MVLFLFSPLLGAKIYRAELGGSFFYQSENLFRDIYGTGFKFQWDIGRKIGENLEVHLGGSYFPKSGELTFTKEKTKVKVIPVGVRLRYIFLKKKVNFYTGGGLSWVYFEEKNPIGTAIGKNIGLDLRVGAFKRFKGFKKILKEFIIDVFIHYQYCEMKPAETAVEVGGVDIGVAFGYEF